MTEICRCCLKSSTRVCPVRAFTVPVEELLRILVPKVFLGASVNPVICRSCYDLLEAVHKFRTQCHRSERLIDNYIKVKGEVNFPEANPSGINTSGTNLIAKEAQSTSIEPSTSKPPINNPSNKPPSPEKLNISNNSYIHLTNNNELRMVNTNKHVQRIYGYRNKEGQLVKIKRWVRVNKKVETGSIVDGKTVSGNSDRSNITSKPLTGKLPETKNNEESLVLKSSGPEETQVAKPRIRVRPVSSLQEVHPPPLANKEDTVFKEFTRLLESGDLHEGAPEVYHLLTAPQDSNLTQLPEIVKIGELHEAGSLVLNSIVAGQTTSTPPLGSNNPLNIPGLVPVTEEHLKRIENLRCSNDNLLDVEEEDLGYTDVEVLEEKPDDDPVLNVEPTLTISPTPLISYSLEDIDQNPDESTANASNTLLMNNSQEEMEQSPVLTNEPTTSIYQIPLIGHALEEDIDEKPIFPEEFSASASNTLLMDNTQEDMDQNPILSNGPTTSVSQTPLISPSLEDIDQKPIIPDEPATSANETLSMDKSVEDMDQNSILPNEPTTSVSRTPLIGDSLKDIGQKPRLLDESAAKASNTAPIDNSQKDTALKGLLAQNPPLADGSTTPSEYPIIEKICKKNPRKRTRIVEVGDGNGQVQPPKKRIRRRGPKPQELDRELFCMFPFNFSRRGDYINDHDYLMGPYKWNYMTVRKASGYSSWCLLCDTTQPTCKHGKHIRRHYHNTLCEICGIDFDNVFNLNLHVRGHLYGCLECRMTVTYAQYKSHFLNHNQHPPLLLNKSNSPLALSEPLTFTKVSTTSGQQAARIIEEEEEDLVVNVEYDHQNELSTERIQTDSEENLLSNQIDTDEMQFMSLADLFQYSNNTNDLAVESSLINHVNLSKSQISKSVLKKPISSLEEQKFKKTYFLDKSQKNKTDIIDNNQAKDKAGIAADKKAKLPQSERKDPEARDKSFEEILPKEATNKKSSSLTISPIESTPRCSSNLLLGNSEEDDTTKSASIQFLNSSPSKLDTPVEIESHSVRRSSFLADSNELLPFRLNDTDDQPTHPSNLDIFLGDGRTTLVDFENTDSEDSLLSEIKSLSKILEDPTEDTFENSSKFDGNRSEPPASNSVGIQAENYLSEESCLDNLGKGINHQEPVISSICKAKDETLTKYPSNLDYLVKQLEKYIVECESTDSGSSLQTAPEILSNTLEDPSKGRKIHTETSSDKTQQSVNYQENPEEGEVKDLASCQKLTESEEEAVESETQSGIEEFSTFEAHENKSIFDGPKSSNECNLKTPQLPSIDTDGIMKSSVECEENTDHKGSLVDISAEKIEKNSESTSNIVDDQEKKNQNFPKSASNNKQKSPSCVADLNKMSESVTDDISEQSDSEVNPKKKAAADKSSDEWLPKSAFKRRKKKVLGNFKDIRKSRGKRKFAKSVRCSNSSDRVKTLPDLSLVAESPLINHVNFNKSQIPPKSDEIDSGMQETSFEETTPKEATNIKSSSIFPLELAPRYSLNRLFGNSEEDDTTKPANLQSVHSSNSLSQSTLTSPVKIRSHSNTQSSSVADSNELLPLRLNDIDDPVTHLSNLDIFLKDGLVECENTDSDDSLMSEIEKWSKILEDPFENCSKFDCSEPSSSLQAEKIPNEPLRKSAPVSGNTKINKSRQRFGRSVRGSNPSSRVKTLQKDPARLNKTKRSPLFEANLDKVQQLVFDVVNEPGLGNVQDKMEKLSVAQEMSDSDDGLEDILDVDHKNSLQNISQLDSGNSFSEAQPSCSENIPKRKSERKYLSESCLDRLEKVINPEPVISSSDNSKDEIITTYPPKMLSNFLENPSKETFGNSSKVDTDGPKSSNKSSSNTSESLSLDTDEITKSSVKCEKNTDLKGRLVDISTDKIEKNSESMSNIVVNLPGEVCQNKAVLSSSADSQEKTAIKKSSDKRLPKSAPKRSEKKLLDNRKDAKKSCGRPKLLKTASRSNPSKKGKTIQEEPLEKKNQKSPLSIDNSNRSSQSVTDDIRGSEMEKPSADKRFIESAPKRRENKVLGNPRDGKKSRRKRELVKCACCLKPSKIVKSFPDLNIMPQSVTDDIRESTSNIIQKELGNPSGEREQSDSEALSSSVSPEKKAAAEKFSDNAKLASKQRENQLLGNSRVGKKTRRKRELAKCRCCSNSTKIVKTLPDLNKISQPVTDDIRESTSEKVQKELGKTSVEPKQSDSKALSSSVNPEKEAAAEKSPDKRLPKSAPKSSQKIVFGNPKDIKRSRGRPKLVKSDSKSNPSKKVKAPQEASVQKKIQRSPSLVVNLDEALQSVIDDMLEPNLQEKPADKGLAKSAPKRSGKKLWDIRKFVKKYPKKRKLVKSSSSSYPPSTVQNESRSREQSSLFMDRLNEALQSVIIDDDIHKSSLNSLQENSSAEREWSVNILNIPSKNSPQNSPKPDTKIGAHEPPPSSLVNPRKEVLAEKSTPKRLHNSNYKCIFLNAIQSDEPQVHTESAGQKRKRDELEPEAVGETRADNPVSGASASWPCLETWQIWAKGKMKNVVKIPQT